MRRKVFFGCSCFYTRTTPISNYDKKWPNRYELGVENWVLDTVIIMQKVDIFVVLARNMLDGAKKKNYGRKGEIALGPGSLGRCGKEGRDHRRVDADVCGRKA